MNTKESILTLILIFIICSVSIYYSEIFDKPLDKKVENVNMAVKKEKITIEDIATDTEVVSEEHIIEPTSRDGEEVNRDIVKCLEVSFDMDLRKLSYVTSEDMEKAFYNTSMAGLGESFVKAEQQYGINAIYLAGLGCLESAWGKSGFAKNRNNLFGWNAKDSNPNAATDFNTKEDGILYVASKLKNNYLTEGGIYFNGYTMSSIDKKYCSDINHAYKIFSIMQTLINRM